MIPIIIIIAYLLASYSNCIPQIDKISYTFSYVIDYTNHTTIYIYLKKTNTKIKTDNYGMQSTVKSTRNAMQSQSEDNTWPAILTTAKHTPRTSPTSPTAKPDLPSPEQQSLIDSLRTSPLTNPDQDPDQSQLKSAIDDILSEYEDESSTGDRDGTEKEEWQNLHAFLAFITKERIVRLEDVGIHVLRVALERGVEHHYHHHRRQHHQLGTGVPPGTGTATGKRKKMTVFVSCAAIWALVMGEELWERRGESPQEEFPLGLSLSHSHSPHESVAPQDQRQGQGQGQGQAAVSKSGWQMWIDRFQFLSLAEDLDIKTRELAAEAAAVMRRVT